MRGSGPGSRPISHLQLTIPTDLHFAFRELLLQKRLKLASVAEEMVRTYMAKLEIESSGAPSSTAFDNSFAKPSTEAIYERLPEIVTPQEIERAGGPKAREVRDLLRYAFADDKSRVLHTRWVFYKSRHQDFIKSLLQKLVG